jgi:hypothetical protein
MNMKAAATRANRRLRAPRRLGSVQFVATLLGIVVYSQTPLRAQQYVGQARREFSQSEDAGALAAFRAANEIEPTNSDAAFWLARVCHITGDLTDPDRKVSRISIRCFSLIRHLLKHIVLSPGPAIKSAIKRSRLSIADSRSRIFRPL